MYKTETNLFMCHHLLAFTCHFCFFVFNFLTQVLITSVFEKKKKHADCLVDLCYKNKLTLTRELKKRTAALSRVL